MAFIVIPALFIMGLYVAWRLRKGSTAFEVFATGTVIALTTAVSAGALLLRARIFEWWSLLGLTVIVGLAAALLLQHRPVESSRRVSRDDVVALAGLFAILTILLAVTPRWNFQLAYEMDAGNYETYANYFATGGSLFLDTSEAADAGVPAAWLGSGNTWTVPEGRPAYLPGFSVLLGVGREALSGDPTSSSLVVLTLALLNALLLYVIARRAEASPTVAALATALVVTTVQYYVYAKQVMSEPFALTGILALILAFQMSDSEESDPWLPVVLASTGGFILAFSKLDGVVNVAMIVFGIWAAAQFGIRARRFPSMRLAVGTTVALVAATSMALLVAIPAYVAHTSLAEVFPALAGLPFSRQPLLIPMALGTGVLLVDLAVRRGPGRQDGPPSRRHRWVPVAFFALWVIYVAYNATLRPLGQTFDNHDALNLIRLWQLSSPVLLVAAGLGLARARALPAITRAVGIGLMLAFAWALYSSQHSPADLWWMRRYLVILTPLLLLAGIGASSVLRDRGVRDPVLLVGAVLLVIVQSTRLLPVLGYQQNSAAPARLVALERHVPDDAAVVVVGGERVIRALGVTLASRRQGITVHNVPRKAIDKALDIVDSRGPEYVLSPLRLRPNERGALDLELVAEGRYSAQWADWYREFVSDPTNERRTKRYWLYVHMTGE